MPQTLLIKNSPLSGIYRNYPVTLTEMAGWRVASDFGQPARERQQLQDGAVLADWSPIGKISISGKRAGAIASQIHPGADAISPLQSCASEHQAMLRLTTNDYLILCQPGMEFSLLQQLEAESQHLTVINQTGALGCFALAGGCRDQVLERSTAVNLRRDLVVPGSVIQSSFHTIRCTLYRTATLEIILHSRNLSESLFNAFLDVGMSAGLMPTGLDILPISFSANSP